MFGIGMPELIIILVIAMLVFGAGKLPDVGNALGQAIRGFKKAVEDPEKKNGESSAATEIENRQK
jgi:sec-independent protein translocase protein TatA